MTCIALLLLSLLTTGFLGILRYFREQVSSTTTKTGLKEQYIEEGIEVGMEEGKRKTALEMMKEDFPKETIARLLKMPVSWVEELTNQ